jgi:hypothetical protein
MTVSLNIFSLLRYRIHITLSGTHSSPLSAFLRVPLPWLRSTTYAYYPDESHSTIRRVFTPWHAPHTKRHFCGFCGTPLSYWSEADRQEADLISVNLSSLRRDSIDQLATLGILPSGYSSEDEKESEERAVTKVSETEIRGEPWFEEIIEGSKLGKIRRRRGGKTSADGMTSVEWEVVEFDGEGNTEPHETGTTSTITGKRKLGEDNVVMRDGP